MPSEPTIAFIYAREPHSISFRRSRVSISALNPHHISNTIAIFTDREDRIDPGLRFKGLVA